ncbi:MAG: hypothetical protein J0L77_02705 [Alphaproteobacteria bacterium]|nr:hypothetical protein [Alphaproteobacteria bacterium]
MGDLITMSQDFQGAADRYAAFNPQDTNFDLGNGKKLSLSLPLSFFLTYGFGLREAGVYLQDKENGLISYLKWYADQEGKKRHHIESYLLPDPRICDEEKRVQFLDLEFEPPGFYSGTKNELHQFRIGDDTTFIAAVRQGGYRSYVPFCCYAREGADAPIKNVSREFSNLAHDEIGKIILSFFESSVIGVMQGKIPDFSKLQRYTNVVLQAPKDIRQAVLGSSQKQLILEM